MTVSNTRHGGRLQGRRAGMARTSALHPQSTRARGPLTWLAVLALAAGGAAVGMGSASQAGADERETRQVQALRERVFQGLAAAQEKLEEEDFSGAQGEIDRLRRIDDLNSYELAQLWNFTGFIRVQQEDLDGAVEAFERVVEQPDIPGGLLEESLNTLIQLSLATEQYEKTLEYGQRWLEITENPGPEPFYRLAVANYQLERYERTVERLNEAIDRARERGGESAIREEYYVLLRASYFQLEDSTNLRDTLEYMVQRWPNKDYWIHLSALYGEKGEERKKLAVLEAIYEDGLMNRENEFVQLAQLYIQAGGPYKGARILEKGMDEGTIEENERHYRLLAQAWMSAQDDRRAIPPLREAADRADDGQLFVQLAQSYLNLGDNEDCVDASRRGLDRGGVRREDTANIVMGMCLFELERYDEAKTAFRRAGQDDRSRNTANQWIQFIDRELQRREDLRRAMAGG